ncbi:Na(+) H(+) antiporter subunit A [Vibrio maritimus]|uniref:Na(+) H(+) antiporter subunit A n=1 Tax=Vibrio maritimus TaxID=990268 RepID=A0A090T4B1_9VIBR|nr:Na(+) H(+) antiporter subunit A [Vibrio maritimus]
MLWIPPALLALGSFIVPVLALSWLNDNIVTPGVNTVAPQVVAQGVKLWQGVNLPLVLSGITLALGVLFHKLSATYHDWWEKKTFKLPVADDVFHKVMAGLVSVAKWQTQRLQHTRLGGYALTSFLFLSLLLLSQLSIGNIPWSSVAAEFTSLEAVIALVMIASVGLCIVATSRLLAVAALGVIGFMSTLVFMLYSAPDVAKTLLLVETLLVVFVALLIRHMPMFSTVPKHSSKRRAVHATVALIIGASVTALLITITAQPIDFTLSNFFAEQSVPGGHGRNIVNVILVDFRAFDTFGEVVVVVIAGISAVSLLNTGAHKQNRIHSLIFATTAHIVAALMLVFSLYLLLRGHNSPGGGFIGALIAVIGLSLLMFAESPRYVRERLYYSPFGIAMFGIALSALSGVVSLLFGLPYLTGLWWKEVLPLGTPLVFDVGIYLAIIGGVMGMLLHVNEELD